MQPDELRAVFVSGQTRRTSGWSAKRALSWTARGATVVVLVLCGVVWIEGRQVSRVADKVASDLSASVGDLSAREDTEELFAESDRDLARIRRAGDEARAYLDAANGTLMTVGDWRNASPTTQVVKAETWIRSAVGNQTQGISDATLRLVASEIAACVNSSIRNAVGADDLPAVEFGARCIAGMEG